MTKILLVEDDKSLREIYGVRLYAEGYDILSAGDGEEALAMAIKDRPALILSDVMMPKISGFDMLDILRSTTETKDIKVIMMTALSSEDQRQRGVSLGADRYLVKSQVGIEDVVRTVHEVLGDAPTSSSPSQPVAPAMPRQAPPPASAATAAGNQAGLPQPTAPFSTPRPANLGDRVINPLAQQNQQQKDFSDLMNEELASIGASPVAPAPTPQQPSTPTPQMPAPSTPPPSPTPAPHPAQPQTQTQPQPQAPQPPQAAHLSFEETPRTAPASQPTHVTPAPHPAQPQTQTQPQPQAPQPPQA